MYKISDEKQQIKTIIPPSEMARLFSHSFLLQSESVGWWQHVYWPTRIKQDIFICIRTTSGI